VDGEFFTTIIKLEKTAQKTTQKIITLIKANPKITRKDLAEKIGINPDGVKYNLEKLKKQGMRCLPDRKARSVWNK